MIMKMVIWPAIDDARFQRLQAGLPSLRIVNIDSLNSALREIIDADAFYGKMTRELLQAARNLRWVQSPTASLEHYLFPELIEHPCQLSNMRGLFSDVIADHVMGFVLSFARNLHRYLRQQLRSEWSPVGDASAVTDFISAPGVVSPVDRAHRHLADCTLGVVGVGHIGGEICRRAAAFDITILGVDPVVRVVQAANSSHAICEVWPMNRLNDLLAESDFVVVAAPHTPASERMIRREQFQRMKPDAIFINIGRGAIVALDDLTAAIQANEIGGAALDVFETEPLPANHPLWTMPNVLITPHVAAASPRVAERHFATLLENARRFSDGRPLLTPVNKREWF